MKNSVYNLNDCWRYSSIYLYSYDKFQMDIQDAKYRLQFSWGSGVLAARHALYIPMKKNHPKSIEKTNAICHRGNVIFILGLFSAMNRRHTNPIIVIECTRDGAVWSVWEKAIGWCTLGLWKGVPRNTSFTADLNVALSILFHRMRPWSYFAFIGSVMSAALTHSN